MEKTPPVFGFSIQVARKEAAKLGFPRKPLRGFVGRPDQVFGQHPDGVEREAQVTRVVQEVMCQCVITLAPVGCVHLTRPKDFLAGVEPVDIRVVRINKEIRIVGYSYREPFPQQVEKIMAFLRLDVAEVREINVDLVGGGRFVHEERTLPQTASRRQKRNRGDVGPKIGIDFAQEEAVSTEQEPWPKMLRNEQFFISSITSCKLTSAFES